MTSVLARLGQLEARVGSTASSTLWSSGTRERARGDWVCGGCWRGQGARKRQRREYSDAKRDDKAAAPIGVPVRQAIQDETSPFAVRSHFEARKARFELPDGEELEAYSQQASAEAEQLGNGWEDTTDYAMRRAQEEQGQEETWEQYEDVEDEDEGTQARLNSPSARDRRAYRHTMPSLRSSFHEGRDPSLLDIDYGSSLITAIEREESDLIARCLFAALQADDYAFLQSLPDPTFSEIIRLLQPDRLVGELATTHLELSDLMTRLLGIPSITHVVTDSSNLLKEVIGIRRASGSVPSLLDYTILLRGAQDLGNKLQAQSLWTRLTADGYLPTTECWNYYMSAVVWAGINRVSTRQTFRVTPFSILARSQRRLGAGYSNYHVGGDEGVKASVTRIFRSMLDTGAIADEASYCTVMMAAAREGDLSSVKSILLKVWNIDVDALIAGTDEAHLTPKPYPPGTRVCPTSRLLFTVAHNFGSNNDISTALRLVDFIARHYNLTIAPQVWSQLFDWTFVLAYRRTGRQAREHGTNTGRIPIDSVQSVWNTMTNAPYRIRPTMIMYNRLIKNLQQRKRTWQILDRMREAEVLLDASRENARLAQQKLDTALYYRETQPERLYGSSIETLRRDWEHAALLNSRDTFWFRRWMRYLLYSTQHAARRDYDGQWTTQVLPRQLWIWRKHAPHRVRYGVANGVVEIVMRTRLEEEMGKEGRRRVEEREDRRRDRAKRYVGEEYMAGRRLVVEEEDAADGAHDAVSDVQR